jgi:hypothetical protein
MKYNSLIESVLNKADEFPRPLDFSYRSSSVLYPWAGSGRSQVLQCLYF